MKTKIFFTLLCSILINTTASLTAQTVDYEMLVSSRNNSSVKRFNGLTGAYINDFIPPGSGGLSTTQDLKIGLDSNILVSGRGNTGILLYGRVSGNFIGTFTSGYSLDNPTKITFGPDGKLYVSQWGTVRNKIARFDGSTGHFIDEFTPSINQALGHLWDSDGNLYVACYGSHDVRKFDTNGNFVSVFTETGHLQGPTNLWFDGNGNLFVIDWDLGKVIQFNASNGSFIKIFISGLQNAEGYAFGPDGNLYICDWTLNRINRYSPSGNFINIFTNQGNIQAPNSILFRPVSTSSVNESGTGVVNDFILSQNYPNPFNPSTTIKYNLQKRAKVKITIYNLSGNELETLFEGNHDAGSYTIQWNPHDGIRDYSTGIYYLRLEADNYSRSIKIAYVK